MQNDKEDEKKSKNPTLENTSTNVKGKISEYLDAKSQNNFALTSKKNYEGVKRIRNKKIISNTPFFAVPIEAVFTSQKRGFSTLDYEAVTVNETDILSSTQNRRGVLLFQNLEDALKYTRQHAKRYEGNDPGDYYARSTDYPILEVSCKKSTTAKVCNLKFKPSEEVLKIESKIFNETFNEPTCYYFRNLEEDDYIKHDLSNKNSCNIF